MLLVDVTNATSVPRFLKVGNEGHSSRSIKLEQAKWQMHASEFARKQGVHLRGGTGNSSAVRWDDANK
jgi:hypothetical protein